MPPNSSIRAAKPGTTNGFSTSSSSKLGSGGGAIGNAGFLTTLAAGLLAALTGAEAETADGADAAVMGAMVGLTPVTVVLVGVAVTLVLDTETAVLADAGNRAAGAAVTAFAALADAAAAAGAEAPVAGKATGPGSGTATPGVLLMLTDAAVPAALFRSPIFFASSATRSEASLACRSIAILSSAAALLCTAPFDKVSLSGAAGAGARSSTRASSLPPACCLAGPG